MRDWKHLSHAKDAAIAVAATSAQEPRSGLVPITWMQVSFECLVLIVCKPQGNSHDWLPPASERKWST